ncbi:MAG: hypothetical protein JOZ20_06940 [Sphingomonas sp.]|nr:hypothetical protein [Sphingomonas sp.]MBW0006412.1 hypothetical protein [Sphingomonas sp.]
MRSFYYRSGKNAATALTSGTLAILAGWQWWSDGDIVWLISVVMLGLAALTGLAKAMNSEPALKFDNERVWVRTAFGNHAVSWKQVLGIALQVMTVRYWGVIPIGRREILCISIEGGSFGARRLRVPAASIELPPGGASALVQILRDAQLAAIGSAGVAMAGAGNNGWGVPSKPAVERDEPSESGFDADAAIARYLASKKASERLQAPAAVQAQPAAPATPQRPVFGRRQAS